MMGWMLFGYSFGLAVMIIIAVWRRVLCRILDERKANKIINRMSKRLGLRTIVVLLLSLMFLGGTASASITFYKSTHGPFHTNDYITVYEQNDDGGLMEDIWNADLSQSYTLVDRNGITGKDATGVVFKDVLRPADNRTFFRYELTCKVENFNSNNPAGDNECWVKVNYTDTRNTIRMAFFDFSDNGTYSLSAVSNLFYPMKNVINSSCNRFGADVTTFDYMINQTRWGDTYRQGNRQYRLDDCGMFLGDGVSWNNCTFRDVELEFSEKYLGFSGKQYFYPFYTSAKSVTRFYDCKIVFNFTNPARNYFIAGSDVYFYNCSIINRGATSTSKGFTGGATDRYFFYNTYIENMSFLVANYSLYNSTFYNCIFWGPVNIWDMINCIFDGFTHIAYNAPINNIASNVIFRSPSIAGFLLYGSAVWGLSDCTFRDMPLVAELFLSYTGKTFLTNVDSDTWAMGSLQTGSVYRNYTQDIQVVNATGVVSGATVTLTNASGVELYSVTTGANGWIAQQNVLLCRFTGTGIVHWQSPYTLLVEKAGYDSVNMSFNNSAQINWTVSLNASAGVGVVYIPLGVGDGGGLAMSIPIGGLVGVLFALVFRRRRIK